MTTAAMIVVRLVGWSPPHFEVLGINQERLARTQLAMINLAVGDVLSDTDLDEIFEALGEFDVEVIYPPHIGHTDL